MKTFYDVQQFLKQFGIIVYVGKRLYDIELMKLESLGSMMRRSHGQARLSRWELFLAETQDRIRLHRGKWR